MARRRAFSKRPHRIPFAGSATPDGTCGIEMGATPRNPFHATRLLMADVKALAGYRPTFRRPSDRDQTLQVLQLHTLGSVYLAGGDGAPLTGAAAQRRLLALLALLATAGSGGISRDRILGILWSESDIERARGALAQALYHARRTLGEDELIVGRDDLRLNRERIGADVWALEEAITAGDLERAAGLYEGPFLNGFFLSGAPEFERWAAEQRSRFEAQIAGVFDRLASDAQSLGDHGRAVEWRRRRAAIDPLDTSATVRLMASLAAAGDRAGALQHARVHETLLRDQLDMAPDAAVTALAAKLRAESDVADRVVAGQPVPDERLAPAGVRAPSPTTDSTLPSPGAVDAVSTPPRRRAWARRRSAVAVLGIIMIGASVVVWTSRSEGRAPTPAPAQHDAQPVVIAPFRVAGADASLAYLREGMVELLSTRLADDSSARSVDPGAVLGAWRAAGLTAAEDVARSVAVRVASELGASRVVFGSVVGTPAKLLVTASVVRVPGGEVIADASVEGTSDSLGTLVDRIAVELLAVEAGERDRLARQGTPSLAALRAYLEGQAQYRRGDYSSAVQHYERALQSDSTFALAALRLAVASDRINDAEQHDRALALAWAAREQLSEADAAHLLAFAGPRYPSPSPETEQLASWQRAVTLAPDRADVWYELGERYFHDGAVLGLADARDRSNAALRRALDLDPGHTPSRRLLVLLAARARDTAALAELATPRALSDSMGDLGDFMRWRVALARNDSTEQQRVREGIPRMSPSNLRAIAMATQFDAVGVEDGTRAIRILRLSRSPRAADQLDGLLADHSLALNEGHPVRALDVTEQLQDVQPGWRAHLRLRILDEIYADGARRSSDGAEEAAEQLSIRVSRGPEATPAAEAIRLADACVVAQWRLARGEVRGVAQILGMLRGAGAPRVPVPIGANPLACAEIVEATMAVVARQPNAAQRVSRLDSLMLSGPAVGDAGTYAHIAVARLYERLGMPERALAAIRRRPYMAGWPRYLATARREEGLLAARLGQRERALTLLQHYLALMVDPEEPVRPLVGAVRAEIARLGGDR